MTLLSMNEVTTYRWSLEQDVENYQQAGYRAIGVWRQKLSDCDEDDAINLLVDSGMQISNVAWAGGFTGSDGRTISGATIKPETGACAGIFISHLEDVWIVDNVLFGNGIAGGAVETFDIVKWADAAGIDSPRYSRIHVRGNKVSGAHTFVSIAVYDADDSDVIGNTIDQGNHGNHQSGYGILLYATEHSMRILRNLVANNVVRNTWGIGIYIQGSLYSVVEANVVENSVQGQTTESLALAAITVNEGQAVISGNAIRRSRQAGISFQGRNTTVQGNAIEGAVTAGIQVNGLTNGSADFSVVSGNVIRGYNWTKNGVTQLSAGTATVVTNEVQRGDTVYIQRTKSAMPEESTGRLAVVEPVNDGSFSVKSWNKGGDPEHRDNGEFYWQILHPVGSHGILVSPTPVDGLRIIGNSIDTGLGTGISAAVDPGRTSAPMLTNATIADNFVTRVPSQSIVVGWGEHVVISGNVVTDGGSTGIDCRANHALVEGNIVGGCAGAAYSNGSPADSLRRLPGLGDFVQVRNNDFSTNKGPGMIVGGGGSSLVRSGNRLTEEPSEGRVQLGVGTCGSGCAVVTTKEFQANDNILITNVSPGGTVGVLSVDTSKAGQFVIKSSSVADTSTIFWSIVH